MVAATAKPRAPLPRGWLQASWRRRHTPVVRRRGQVEGDERPHEALGQTTPATLFNHSSRPYAKKLPELQYPEDYELRRLTSCGHFRWRGQVVWVSTTLAGETVGLKAV